MDINDIVTLEELKKEFNKPNVIGSVFDTKDNICYDLKENVTSSKKFYLRKVETALIVDTWLYNIFIEPVE
ncbi:MAG TPA: hypothetical protein PK626_00010 [Bacteroidales bacterium]|nr:hypothetical protein [Bacteroidales bacterium]